MKINGSTDKVGNTHNSPKYYKEMPVQVRNTNQYKPSNTPGTKGGSKNGNDSLGKLGRG